MFLAICSALLDDEVYTMTRALANDPETPQELLSSFSKELGLSDEFEVIESIIIVKNGFIGASPEVVHNWSAKNGDFDA